MAFLGGTFDANAVEPAQDLAPIPSGEYLAHIIDSDMKATKSGTGQYLELTYEVIDGPYKGRKVWTRLNLHNPNAKAVEIAQRDLSAICHATGQLQVQDSQQLHYKPHVIRVEYVEADGDRRQRAGNEVKAYKRAEGYAPTITPGPQAPSPQGALGDLALRQAAANPAAPPPWASRG